MKTDQIFEFPSEIAMNTDVTGEHNLVCELEPYSCLLLAGAGIDCSQIQI